MLKTVHRHESLSCLFIRAVCLGLVFTAVLPLSPAVYAQQDAPLTDAIAELPSSVEGIGISNSPSLSDSQPVPTPIEFLPSPQSNFPYARFNQPVRIVSDFRPIARPIKTMADIVLRSQEISTKNVLGKRLVHVRAQDEVWLVSARNETDGPLSCQRLIDGQWSDSSVDDLTAAKIFSPTTPTVVYVHGDRTDEQYARSRGLQFYENIFNPDECSNTGPIRFVIFAWKAEREIVRPSFDYRLKLVRSVELGQTFRSFLHRFDDRQMLLIGFSLGGQVILSGISAAEAPDANCGCNNCQAGRYRLALVTPSLDPQQARTCITPLPSLASVKETCVFVNKKDNAIRAAKIVNRNDGVNAQKALSALAKRRPTCGPNQIHFHNMTREVSRCHSITKYSESSILLQSELLRMCDDMRPSVSFGGVTATQESN